MTTSTMRLHDFARACACGVGATRDANGRWHYDVRHGPPRGKLPLGLHMRAAASPEALGGSSLVTLPLAGAPPLDAPALQLEALSALATPALAFMEPTAAAVLPDEYDAARGPEGSARLFWRLVATDSCEAVHCGVLLALRRLTFLHASQLVVCDERGVPLVEFGMHTATRVAPFTRHIKLTASSVSADAVQGSLRLSLRSGPPPPPASHGGVMHQLVWLKAADGRETVCDFTGPQYGIDEALPTMGTPFWSCDVSDGGASLRRRFGFELRGKPAAFHEPAAVAGGVLDNELHAYMALWMRDSIMGVLAFERAIAGPQAAAS